MQLGYNQNVTYKGETFHVQTEDGGRSNPVISTAVFKGGSIVGSRRTSYADIIKYDKLDTVVKDLMRDQHRGVIEDLLKGVFDRR